MRNKSQKTELKQSTQTGFQVIEYVGSNPSVVQRISDNTIFKLGDRVTNGSPIKGKIILFSVLGEDMYVTTTWSGIGMALNEIYFIQILPSHHQLGDKVTVSYGDGVKIYGAWVIKIHFTESKVSYDVEFPIVVDGRGYSTTRMYNIDSVFVEAA